MYLSSFLEEVRNDTFNLQILTLKELSDFLRLDRGEIIITTQVAVTVHALIFFLLIPIPALLVEEKDGRFKSRAFFAIAEFSIFISATKVSFFL